MLHLTPLEIIMPQTESVVLEVSSHYLCLFGISWLLYWASGFSCQCVPHLRKANLGQYPHSGEESRTNA